MFEVIGTHEVVVEIVVKGTEHTFYVTAATEKEWGTDCRKIGFSIATIAGVITTKCALKRIPYEEDFDLMAYALEQVNIHGQEWINTYYEKLWL